MTVGEPATHFSHSINSARPLKQPASFTMTMPGIDVDRSYWEQVVNRAPVLDGTRQEINSLDDSGSDADSDECLENLLYERPEKRAYPSNGVDLQPMHPYERNSGLSPGPPTTLLHCTDASTHLASRGSSNTNQTLDNTAFRKLSSRCGRLSFATQYQPHFYGAVSNMHLTSSNSFPSTLPATISSGDSISQGTKTNHHDLPYEDELTDLFFLWQNPVTCAIPKTQYTIAKRSFMAGTKTQLYSLALKYAILTLGSAYSRGNHPSAPRGCRSAEHFALCARAAIDAEMDSPTLATVQALLVLLAHEAGEGHDSRGMFGSNMRRDCPSILLTMSHSEQDGCIQV